MKRPKRLLGIIAALAVMTSTIAPVYANQVDPEWYSLYEEGGYEDDTEDTEDDTAEEDDPYSVEAPTAVQAPAQTPAETDTITDTVKPDDSAPEEKVTLGMSLHLDELEEDDVTKDDVDWCEWDPVTGTMTLKGQLPDTSLSSTFADQAGIDKSLIKKVYASPYGATAGAKLDYAFYGLTNLQEAYLYTLKGITGSTSAIGLFTGCSSLRYVNIYYWGNLDTASTKTLGLFAGCSSIEMLTLPKGFEFDTLTGLYNKQNSCLGWTKDDSLDIIGGDGTYAIFTTSASGTYIRRRTDWYEWDGSTLTLKGKLPLTAIGTSLADIAGIDNEAVKKAVIRSDTTASISLKSAFSDFYNLESVEHLNYLDTSDVTDMRYMFEDCRSLTKLEFGSFGTKNLQSMSYMFSYCYKLEELDIYSFDMSNVLNTADMFSYCSKLSSLCLPIGFQVTEDMKLHNIPDSGSTYTGDILGWAKYSSNTIVGGSGKYAVFTSVGGWYEFRKLQWYEWNENTHTLTLKGQLPDAGPWIGEGSESHYWNFAEMAGLYWSDYSNIEKVIIKPNTKAGTSLAHAFENFKNLTEIQGLANLDTSATEDMGYMFRGCFSLTSLDLSKFNTAKVKDMGRMFYSCFSLTSLDLSAFNTAKVKDMACMFYECESLTSLILPDSDISACDYMDHIFKGCKALPALDLSGFKNLTGTIVETFAGCDALTSLTLPAGFEITNHMCLHNRIGNDPAVSGWAKAGTNTIISTSETTEGPEYAAFTADTAGEYVLISIKWYEWDESTGTLTL
ncbi:MAG: BspA family leucine-rich repeat surface protein, partial [Oscillospiraceae bacterium]|nr:BspA family leucine-rich repeat surface protein [Oscillospiraceae bacterium]